MQVSVILWHSLLALSSSILFLLLHAAAVFLFVHFTNFALGHLSTQVRYFCSQLSNCIGLHISFEHSIAQLKFVCFGAMHDVVIPVFSVFMLSRKAALITKATIRRIVSFFIGNTLFHTVVFLLGSYCCAFLGLCHIL